MPEYALTVRFRRSPISSFRPSTVHTDLGAEFYDPVEPARFPQHILRYRNQAWAQKVGLGGLSDADWIDHFGRFQPFEGSFKQPLALRYHGHQFQNYNADLGDGRGFLFAQLYDDQDRLLDFGTKGSGPTPWSRGGDGKLTLKGGVREVLATAMLEALGVNTSKSFSLIETGEELYRGDEPSPTRSAVLVRLSHSHIRIGTFQRQAFLRDEAALARLVEHCVQHYVPEARRENAEDTTVALLEAVCANVAVTGAQLIAAGFVHGVLNSDNINITGESFDYGPWRFLPTYDPAFTAAYFDQSGLYAFGRQPDALAWNLTRFAECLLPLAEQEPLEKALNSFWPRFQDAMLSAYLGRLGLVPTDASDGRGLLQALFTFMGGSQAPYEQVLFDWRGGLASHDRALSGPNAEFYRREDFEPLRAAFEMFETAEDANLTHPYFARQHPRTMLIEEMEAIWSPIANGDDWQLFNKVLDEIAQMGVAYGNAPAAGVTGAQRTEPEVP